MHSTAARAASAWQKRRRENPALVSDMLVSWCIGLRSPEKVKEIGRGLPCHPFQRLTAQSSDVFGNMPHKARLVGPAAKRDRREVGCVGFDQHALQGNGARHCLQIPRALESHNAGE